MPAPRILIAGSNDIATATAIRLYRSGFSVILFSSPHPLDIHHKRTFSGAVFSGIKSVLQVTAVTFAGSIEQGDLSEEKSVNEFVTFTHSNRRIPIVLPDDVSKLDAGRIDYLFTADAELSALLPESLQTQPVQIGLYGKGAARYNVFANGPCRGQVDYAFLEEACSAQPEDKTGAETVRAPLEGVFTSAHSAGDLIHEKQELGRINDIPILSPITGLINGLLNSGAFIPAGIVFAEIVSAGHSELVRHVPESAFAVAGGVLEVVLFDQNL